jgi:hypothetical protein
LYCTQIEADPKNPEFGRVEALPIDVSGGGGVAALMEVDEDASLGDIETGSDGIDDAD